MCWDEVQIVLIITNKITESEVNQVNFAFGKESAEETLIFAC